MNIVTKATGDSLTAGEFNQIPDELENVIISGGLSPDDQTLTQVATSISQYCADGNFYNTAGTANAIILNVISPRKSVNSLTNGFKARFKAIYDNTGSCTINVANLGSKDLYYNGLALSAGEIKANEYYEVIYNSTLDKFILEKSPRLLVKYFDTVSSLTSNTLIEIGDFCITCGYFSKNDGGGSIYTIRAKDVADVEDGGSIIFLQNDLVAELVVINSTINIKQFGAKGDGITEDTTAIQNAVDFCSTNKYEIKFNYGTYIVVEIVPKTNTIIDLCGSTLKVKDNSQSPAIHSTTTSHTFYIKNGTIDGNMQNNYSANLSGGGIYLTNWTDIKIDVNFVNIFRECVWLYNCSNADLNIIADTCGLSGHGYYCYVLDTTECSYLNVRNLVATNIFGYGTHIYKTENSTYNNMVFKNFTQGGYSIGITLTQAKNITIENFEFYNGDNLAIECNCSTYINVNNTLIDTCKIGITTGDNGTGTNNDYVSFKNVLIKNTSVRGARLNYITNLWLEKFSMPDFDFTVNIMGNEDNGYHFIDGVFTNMYYGYSLVDTSILGTLVLSQSFDMQNVQFLDIYVSQKNRKHMEGKIIIEDMANGDNRDIVNLFGILGPGSFGYFKLLGKFNNSQYSLDYYNITRQGTADSGLAMNLISDMSIDKGRHFTPSFNGHILNLANSSGVTIWGDIYFDTYR